MEKNYEDWMTKTVETEKQDWLLNALPDHDGQEKYYHTSAPVIIFQMIDQHLQVTNTIHSEFTFSALVLSIQQVTKYGQNYRQCIIEFKDKHFKDRSQVRRGPTLCPSFFLEFQRKCFPHTFLSFCWHLDPVLHSTPHHNCEQLPANHGIGTAYEAIVLAKITNRPL